MKKPKTAISLADEERYKLTFSVEDLDNFLNITRKIALRAELQAMLEYIGEDEEAKRGQSMVTLSTILNKNEFRHEFRTYILSRIEELKK